MKIPFSVWVVLAGAIGLGWGLVHHVQKDAEACEKAGGVMVKGTCFDKRVVIPPASQPEPP